MVLIVNGERIEDSVIQQEAEHLRPDYERVFADNDPKEREAQLLDWSRENVIERVLVSQEAKKYDVEVPRDKIESALAEAKKQYAGKKQPSKEAGDIDDEKLREDIELQFKTEQMLEDVCKDMPEPSEETLQEYYQENKEQFRSPERIRAAHIVKHISWQTDEKAAYDTMIKAQKELKNGAAFETLVAKYSDCPERGGDLGYITKGQMVEEFEDVAFNLGVNGISDIFRTRFGFHIAKLYDRKPAVLRSLEEVRNEIVKAVGGQMRSRAIDEFIDRLKAKARMEEI